MSPAVLGEVSEATTAQTVSWQLAGRYSVRVGETVETSVAKLCADPPSLRELLWMRLNRGGRRMRLLPGEDVPPPIDGRGGDHSLINSLYKGLHNSSYDRTLRSDL